MIANNHIEPEDLTLYALHFLTEQENAAIAEHLAHCAGCSDAVALLRGDLAALALTVDVVVPSANSRQRLLTQVAREKKAIPIDRPQHLESGSPFAEGIAVSEISLEQSRTSARVLPWISWIGWAVAAGLTVAVTNVVRDRDSLRSAVALQASEISTLSLAAEKGRSIMSALTDPSAVRVTLVQAPSAKSVPVGRASYVAEKGALLFTASNLDPLESLKTYELWILPADGSSPVPAGTFTPDARGNATLIMPSIPKGVIAKGFGITIEDEGGALKPTPPIVLSGE